MQKKYGKDGVVSVSVSLDNPRGKSIPEKVLNFLNKQQATITNLLLNEHEEVWQKKLDIDGPPCIYIFNREGKITEKYNRGEGYKEVEEAVKGLLR